VNIGYFTLKKQINKNNKCRILAKEGSRGFYNNLLKYIESNTTILECFSQQNKQDYHALKTKTITEKHECEEIMRIEKIQVILMSFIYLLMYFWLFVF
jgi:hypothetical protein